MFPVLHCKAALAFGISVSFLREIKHYINIKVTWLWSAIFQSCKCSNVIFMYFSLFIVPGDGVVK